MTTGISGQKHAYWGQVKSRMPHGITVLERFKIRFLLVCFKWGTENILLRPQKLVTSDTFVALHSFITSRREVTGDGFNVQYFPRFEYMLLTETKNFISNSVSLSRTFLETVKQKYSRSCENTLAMLTCPNLCKVRFKIFKADKSWRLI
jgi:hypothetical protein